MAELHEPERAFCYSRIRRDSPSCVCESLLTSSTNGARHEGRLHRHPDKPAPKPWNTQPRTKPFGMVAAGARTPTLPKIVDALFKPSRAADAATIRKLIVKGREVGHEFGAWFQRAAWSVASETVRHD